MAHDGARLGADGQADRAALGADRLAVQQDSPARRDVDQAVLRQGQVALAAFQHDRAAFEVRQVADVAAGLHIDPQAAGVQRHALADRQIRHGGAARAARRNRGQGDRAAAGRDVGLDVDGLSPHGHVAAGAQGQVPLDLDGAAVDAQRTQSGLTQGLGRQEDGVQQIRRQRRPRLDPDRAAAFAHDHGVGERNFLRQDGRIGLVQLVADIEAARQRGDVLRQVIAVEPLREVT
ncbi:hypothetical protein D3C72_903160 [compost metagenome]